ncbi:MAG: type I-E CRISPR-associated protein Cse2/CasB [Gammaproteobacteria bacterium]|nr:type I-E CRISPR-associated protein Cse2/CasB [Gammaproteobacteria bacterium]
MSEQKESKPSSTAVLKEDETQAVLGWYHWLHGEKQKGIRARLKRCGSLDEVITEQGFLRLNQMLPRLQQYDLIGVALVAGVLAIAKHEDAASLPALLGRAKEGGDKPVFSELRFQRLLASDDEEQLYQNMRRAVIQAGEKANPLALADSLLHWYREHRHPDWFSGNRQWQYQVAKTYYTEVFNYQKGV